MTEVEIPWVSVREVCAMYGVTYDTAKNKILAGTFDVPTYKVGKTWVIDRCVHQQYFSRLREEGLSRMKSSGGS
jgi:hypothetical protein